MSSSSLPAINHNNNSCMQCVTDTFSTLPQQGLLNWRTAWHGHIITNPSVTSSNLTYSEQASLYATGFFLIIPIINVVVMKILKLCGSPYLCTSISQLIAKDDEFTTRINEWRQLGPTHYVLSREHHSVFIQASARVLSEPCSDTWPLQKLSAWARIPALQVDRGAENLDPRCSRILGTDPGAPSELRPIYSDHIRRSLSQLNHYIETNPHSLCLQNEHLKRKFQEIFNQVLETPYKAAYQLDILLRDIILDGMAYSDDLNKRIHFSIAKECNSFSRSTFENAVQTTAPGDDGYLLYATYVSILSDNINFGINFDRPPLYDFAPDVYTVRSLINKMEEDLIEKEFLINKLRAPANSQTDRLREDLYHNLRNIIDRSHRHAIPERTFCSARETWPPELVLLLLEQAGVVDELEQEEVVDEVEEM